ncbi:unnamed protein product, partial [Porites evermanni]
FSTKGEKGSRGDKGSQGEKGSQGQKGIPGTCDTKSTVWSGGHFVKLQSLQTYGARDVKSFNVNGHTFLAFANYYSGSKYNIDSFIYKWNGNTFVLFQSIPTRGASAWCPFVINGQT